MPFILIRACLWLILSGAIIARAKIAKTVRKKPAAIMAVVLCTLLLTASAVFPVENLLSGSHPRKVCPAMPYPEE